MTDDEKIALERENAWLRAQLLQKNRSPHDRFFDAVSRGLNRVFPGFKTKGLAAVGAAIVAWAAENPELAAQIADDHPREVQVLSAIWFFLTYASREAAKRQPPKIPPALPGREDFRDPPQFPDRPGAKPGTVAGVALAILAVALVAIPQPAEAWWGKNKIVDCYVDERGNTVQLTREVCKLHYRDEAFERADLTRRQLFVQLKLDPPDCDGLSSDACALLQYQYTQARERVMTAPDQSLQLANNQAERDHEAKMQTRRMILEWATFGLNTYVALEGTKHRGIGDGGVSFRGDTVSGKAGGGAGGGGDAGGPGGGSEVGKQGDTYQVYVGKGGRVQFAGGGSAASGQENYEDAAQNRPALGEGSTFSPSNDERRNSDRTIGLGEVF